MQEIHIPGKGPVQTEFVGEVESVLVFADENSRPIVTGKFTGADELTDLGISYGELDKILKLDSKPHAP
jgi:hypothetical protein